MTEIEQQRDDFENHFLRCPYEWDFTRLGDESPWAGDYRDTAVCFAWDAWQAAIEHDRKQQQEPVAWVTGAVAKGQLLNGMDRRIWWENYKGVGTPIYLAPQAAIEHNRDQRGEPVKAAPPSISDERESLEWFERRFSEIEEGDGDMPIPRRGDGKRYDAYLERHQSALTGWVMRRDYEQGQQPGYVTPLAWINEADLPADYPYDALYPYSEIYNGVRRFPVYGPHSGAQQDAERFRWLTDDHADHDVHSNCGAILRRMHAIDYVTACLAIDAARAQRPEENHD